MHYKYSEEDYREAVASSTSIAGVARKLGLVPRGGNYQTINRAIARHEIDASHFLGQGHNAEKFKSIPKSKVSIKKKLIRERGTRCENCNRKKWLGQTITLELEHNDGNNQNNEESNLTLMCPNCHSQTKTWKRKKSAFEPNTKKRCPTCGGAKAAASRQCSSCDFKGRKGTGVENIRTTKIAMTRAEVESLVVQIGFSQAGRRLGVSSTSVRNYLKNPTIISVGDINSKDAPT